jgi:DNA-nicking Smr family endonuclease
MGGYFMPTIDFHGLSVEEAISTVNKLIDDARSCNATYHCTFITGHGKINKAIKKLLEKEKLECNTMVGNDGTLLADIE